MCLAFKCFVFTARALSKRTMKGYTPFGALVVHRVKPQDLTLGPQPPPPEEAVHQHSQT